MMQTFVRPSRDLRNHYAEISEMLKDHDHVIITNHGRGESVLINIEDYAKYEEFLHQRYVAEALAKAKQQAADPDVDKKALAEQLLVRIGFYQHERLIHLIVTMSFAIFFLLSLILVSINVYFLALSVLLLVLLFFLCLLICILLLMLIQIIV